MTATLFSSELIARLRRSALVTTVVFLSLGAAACGGDDDDDDISGPTADCIDDFDFGGLPFDRGDVEGIEQGDSESGSLSENDPEEDGYFADIFFIGFDSSEDIEISLNPNGFDAVLLLYDESFSDPIAGSDDPEDAGATEVISGEISEGCYVIVVTSFDEGETGSYTLSVD